jgi:transcriptional regulator with XRE-family HTH domain
MNKSNNVSITVRELREKKGWSQGKLAEVAGIDRKTVNRIENGHYVPSVGTLLALSNAFGTSTSKLLGS